MEVQTPKMKLAVEKVSIMVPGVTREFGTFSIFRRNGLKVEFLVEQSSRDENGDLVTNIKPEPFDILNANVLQVIILICPLKNANWTQTDSQQQHAFHAKLEPVPVMSAVLGHTLILIAIPPVDLENNLELIALLSLLLTRMLLIRLELNRMVTSMLMTDIGDETTT